MSKRSRLKQAKKASYEPIEVFLDSEAGTLETNGYHTSEEVKSPTEYSMNWNGDGNGLIPKLLMPDERPDITSETIRELINNTARGTITPPGLRERLSKEPIDAIYDGIKEGIQRWHTYGKERG